MAKIMTEQNTPSSGQSPTLAADLSNNRDNNAAKTKAPVRTKKNLVKPMGKTQNQMANTKPPFTSHSWLKKVGIGFLVLIMAGGALAVVKKAQMLPDANITIDKTNLNAQQLMQLQTALGKKAQGNFYQADLQDYQARAEALPWVSQVDVKRDWQKGLIVTAIPRQPVAKFGSEKLIDAVGHVFTPADSDQINSQKWMQLQGDSEKSPLIMQQTEQVIKWFHPLQLKVEEVILTPRMTWLYRFDNGMRVLVDKDATSEKLYQLSILLQNQLKTKLPQIETIDLRYKNGMALTWKHPVNMDNASPISQTTSESASKNPKPPKKT